MVSLHAQPIAPCAPLAEIEIRGKSFADPIRGERRHVLEQIRLELALGEVVAIVGPSGCGKTTLLQILAGLDDDFDGQVRWKGPGGDTATHRQPRLGYVFQNPRLLPWLSLRRNIELVMDGLPHRRRSVDDLLEATGLMDAADTLANRLSVGMQRRAALARAFAVRPELLLMDEPFVSLDAPTAHQLRLLLLEIWGRSRPTVVLVTHDLLEATMLADRILLMSPPPCRPLAEIAVETPREQRRDARAVERECARVEARFGRLYSRG